jgi:hypothetical protein
LGLQEGIIAKDNPDFLVCFDRGDVSWLRGYCHLLSGLLNFYLAFDTEEEFDRSAEKVFANPKQRVRGTDEPKKAENRGAFPVFAVQEPIRLGRVRRHLLKVAELNRETWRHIRAETDDDHKWLPNPKQTGVLGLKVRDDMIDAWLDAVGELEGLLAGTKTLPPDLWGEKNGKVVSLRAVLDDPPARFELNLLSIDLPDKYWVPKGTTADVSKVWRVLDVFGNNASRFAYAVWFN